MHASLLGCNGVFAVVPLDQSYRDAVYQFERAYFRYQLGDRRGRYARVPATSGLGISHFYSRCRQLGVPVRGR